MRVLVSLLVLFSFLAIGCGGGGDDGADISESAAFEETVAKLTDEVRSETVIARINDKEITFGDIRQHMLKRSTPERVDELIKNVDIVQVALTAIVDQYVWSEMAKAAGWEMAPNELRQIQALEAQFLSTRYVAEVIQAKAKPSDEDVKAWYNENQANYLRPVTIGARHIQLRTREEAEMILARVEGGEDFAALAREVSVDPATQSLGGALGFVSPGKAVLGLGRDEKFERGVLPMGAGETKIVESAEGWHVVRAEKREGGALIPLEEVYDTIEQGLIPRKLGAIYQEELILARESTNAHIDEVALEIVTGTKGNTGRMMLAAEDTKEHRGQVEIYRRIVYDFPGSKWAPEAQFRMGYVLLVEQDAKAPAIRELKRLQERFPNSSWGKAAEYLLERVDSDPATIESVEEIMKQITK